MRRDVRWSDACAVRVAGASCARARAPSGGATGRAQPVGRVLTAAVCVLAGLMVVVSALNARGTDLRPGRNTDLVSLVQAQSRQQRRPGPPGHRAAAPRSTR